MIIKVSHREITKHIALYRIGKKIDLLNKSLYQLSIDQNIAKNNCNIQWSLNNLSGFARIKKVLMFNEMLMFFESRNKGKGILGVSKHTWSNENPLYRYIANLVYYGTLELIEMLLPYGNGFKPKTQFLMTGLPISSRVSRRKY